MESIQNGACLKNAYFLLLALHGTNIFVQLKCSRVNSRLIVQFYINITRFASSLHMSVSIPEKKHTYRINNIQLASYT